MWPWIVKSSSTTPLYKNYTKEFLGQGPVLTSRHISTAPWQIRYHFSRHYSISHIHRMFSLLASSVPALTVMPPYAPARREQNGAPFMKLICNHSIVRRVNIILGE